MTLQQKAIIRYWLIGFAVLMVFSTLLLGDYEHFRLLALPAMIVLVVLDKSIRPRRPESAPTPLEIIENSRSWKLFVIFYGIAAVFIAVLSIVFHDLGSWLSQHDWLLILAIVPIVGPVFQSEAALFRAYGEKAGQRIR